MKITDVQAILKSSPLRLPFWGGERTILKRDAMPPKLLSGELRAPTAGKLVKAHG